MTRTTKSILAILVLSACLALNACASKWAKGYVGKSAVDLELENGKPVNIVELPGGRRSYQYYWGAERMWCHKPQLEQSMLSAALPT